MKGLIDYCCILAKCKGFASLDWQPVHLGSGILVDVQVGEYTDAGSIMASDLETTMEHRRRAAVQCRCWPLLRSKATVSPFPW